MHSLGIQPFSQPVQQFPHHPGRRAPADCGRLVGVRTAVDTLLIVAQPIDVRVRLAVNPTAEPLGFAVVEGDVRPQRRSLLGVARALGGHTRQ